MPGKFYRFVVGEGLVEIGQEGQSTECPYVIGDEMPLTLHPATGRYYDSKSAFRRDTRAAGYVEVGNDWKGGPPPSEKPRADIKEVRRHVVDAWEKLSSRS